MKHCVYCRNNDKISKTEDAYKIIPRQWNVLNLLSMPIIKMNRVIRAATTY